MKYTFKQFQAQYPNDDACLDAIMNRKYGNINCCPTCGIEGKLTRIQGRRAYACKEGCHIYPCVNTPFEHSSTPLTLWFHAMYLMTATRNGVSAKELERQLGVTYKTAWRIGHELRKLMAGKNNTNPPMSGHIEVDETYVGGKAKGKRGRGAKNKTIVAGVLERKGNISAHVIPNVSRRTLESLIESEVVVGSTISTDELQSYKNITKLGYSHGTVLHGIDQYVNGIHHVNGVECFWSHLKRSIRGTYIHVSGKHMQKYVSEFSWRYNLRNDPAGMFNQLMASL
ncbi:MAG: IS1595 family transposase [Nitrosomonas sp.]|nr:IS1595 family transposase [Nitrosomonas sp.]UJP00437.1 MAG: IS1595 family transposase [Nitrosomonas sp.]